MKKIFGRNLLNIGFLLYYELLFALFMFDSFSKETIISILIYTLFISFIITVLTSIFSK